MITNFNFSDSSLNVQIEKKAATRLHGNLIHKVVLKSCSVDDLDTKNGKVKVLSFTFEGADGLVYVDNIFEPRSQERKQNDKGYTNPSEYDMFMTKIRIYSKILAPKLFDLMNAGKLPPVNGWEQLTTMLSKQFQVAITSRKEFQIKLLKNNDGWPTLPRYFLSFNKDGEMYISSRFIAEVDDILEFTKSEAKKINEEQTFTPSKMPNIAPTKDDVMDMVTGITGNANPQAVAPNKDFGGGEQPDWSDLLGQV